MDTKARAPTDPEVDVDLSQIDGDHKRLPEQKMPGNKVGKFHFFFDLDTLKPKMKKVF